MTGCAICGKPTDIGESVHQECADVEADRALAEMVEALAPLCKCCGFCSSTICGGAAQGGICERICRCDEEPDELFDDGGSDPLDLEDP